MNEQEIKHAIYAAVWRIVRQINPPKIEEFFDQKVKDTLPTGGAPGSWENFWWESLAVEIQGAMLSRKRYITNFDYKILKDREGKKWQNIYEYIESNLD